MGSPELGVQVRDQAGRRWSRVLGGGLSALFALVLAVAFVAPASAQETGRIVGRVTDAASGAPQSDVQVFLPGTGLGSLTRANGAFVILNVPPGQYELHAERIGLEPVTRQVTVAAGQAAEVDFQMSTQALGLDEIVVTGTAGAARRREVGNTIAQINVAELPQKPTNVADLLQSTAPGVDVTLGGAGAGQGQKIRLRGANSVAMSSDPIIYIDGVRMMSGGFPQQSAKDHGNRSSNVTQSPLDLLNPNDIERIEVIKGSAATTLYGTEASAGVIQVFTKKGTQGRPVWTVETLQGTLWNQRFGTNGVNYVYMDPWICTGPFKCGDLMPHAAYTQNYSASVRGGAQSLSYFSSAQLENDHGNTPNDWLRKWTARSNFTYTPASALQLQVNTAYTNQWQRNSPEGNNAEGIELNAFRQNQNYFHSADPNIINQVFDQVLGTTIERFTTGGTMTYSPTANLTTRFTIGYDFSNEETRDIRPFGFYSTPEGIIYTSNYQRRILTFDYVGSYNFGIMEGLQSSFSWGGQAVGDEKRQVEGYGVGFPGSAEPTVSSASTTSGYEERQKLWNAGFFLQDIFNIRDRYFITLGARMDGNSAFGSGFGLQFYPKVSGSWVISDEGFWQDGWGTVKLRAAYGQSGRAPGAFDAVRTWHNTPLAGNPAFTPQNVGNPDLGPEVTGEWEAGFDGSWMDDRVRATYTYYHQLTKDALLDVAQMPSLGFTNTQLTNIGEIENKGQEVSLDVSVLRGANLGWDVGVNLATNNSKVLSSVVAEDVGKPIHWEYHSIVHNPDAVPSTPGVLPICKDSTPATDPCLELTVFRGSSLPTKTISGYTTLRLPYGITLATRGEFRGGNYVSAINPIAISRSVRSPACLPYYANNDDVTLKADAPALWVARCTPSLGRYDAGYSQKGDYFKLRSVTATVPVNFIFPDQVSNASLTLQLNNAYTWAGESLWGTYGYENFSNSGVNSEAASLGISSNERIPPPTSLTISLRVTF